jgi:hypothetical protein
MWCTLVKLVLSILDEAQESLKTKPNSKVVWNGRIWRLKAPELFGVALERSLELANSALMDGQRNWDHFILPCAPECSYRKLRNSVCLLCKLRGDKSTRVVWCHLELSTRAWVQRVYFWRRELSVAHRSAGPECPYSKVVFSLGRWKFLGVTSNVGRMSGRVFGY